MQCWRLKQVLNSCLRVSDVERIRDLKRGDSDRDHQNYFTLLNRCKFDLRNR